MVIPSRRLRLGLVVPTALLAMAICTSTEWSLTAAEPAPGSHPYVAGFERFYADGQANRDGGELLLGELNCTSCHASAEVGKKPAPILDGIGSRVNGAYLKKYLLDPTAVKPRTTMPALLTGDPAREEKAENLAHYLASMGQPKQARPDLKLIVKGNDHYSKLGCAVCHGPRDISAELRKNYAGPTAPLGDLKAKYTIPGLTAFLTNPLQYRPGGRMPHLLKGAEPAEIANYLLQGLKTGLPVGKGTAKFSYFEGDWQKLPDFGKMKPKAAGVGLAFDLGSARRGSNYGIRFEGVFEITAAGEYKFTLGSDDGSRLLIDGRTIVDNDGIHAPASKNGKVELTKGVHTFILDFFQGGGGAELEVEIEGRNIARQPLAAMTAPSEKELQEKPPGKAEPNELFFAPDAERAAKGKELFQSMGCVNCHDSGKTPKQKSPIVKAKPVAELKGGGCLAEKPPAGLPVYGLSGAQRTALTAVVGQSLKKHDAAATTRQTMTALNCYACHSRDKVGGPTELTATLFQTTQPEMGDEGRLPPPLDGVGSKLRSEYVNQILDKGADDRPYMHVRMPGFGLANAGHLTAHFESTDKLPTAPAVKFTDPEAKVKSSGRHMVGAQAFGCIKCHTFAGNKAEGVQGIDMMLMPKRIKHDWFYAYLIDPQKVRPGTRMPTGWPMGMSTLPNLLDGQASTQIEAIWVYLTAKDVQLPVGLGKKFIPLMPIGEAVIYRNFIQGAGSRAIGVGYPEKLNLAFDANDLRIAMIWQGGFIDAARHWTDRGTGFEGPLGDNITPLPTGAPFAVLKSDTDAWPTAAPRDSGFRFLGYKTTPDERPTFRYAFNNVTIEDFPNPTGKVNPNLARRFTFTTDGSAPDGLTFRAAVGAKIDSLPGDWFKIDTLKIKAPGGRIRTAAGKMELLIPVRLKDGKADLTIEYSW